MSVNVQKIFVKLDIVIKMQLKDSELGNLKSRFLPRLCIETHKSMSCLHSSSTEGDLPDESACSPLCISQSEQQPTPSEIRFVNVQKIFVKLDIVLKMQLKNSELGNLKSRFLPRLCIETHKSMSCLHSSTTEGDVQDDSVCSPPRISPCEKQKFLVQGTAGTLEQETTSTPINTRFV